MATEIPANDDWYCKVFGTEFGPLPGEAVRRMLEMEQLSAEDLVRAGSSGPWQTVREVADLRALLKGDDSRPGSTSPERLPQSDEPPDGWYYELDGRTHGPLTLCALVELIGASGDTAQEVVVRQTREGAWMPFNSLPGISPSPAPANRPDRLQQASTTSTMSAGSGRARARFIRRLVRENLDLTIALAVWLLLNGVILVAWTQSYATERRYFATLRILEAETRALQARDAPGQDWAVFRARVKQTLAPMVADLKKRASASEPIRQHLLWAARDQFPKCVGPRSSENSESQHLYQRRMRVVEEELAEQ